MSVRAIVTNRYNVHSNPFGPSLSKGAKLRKPPTYTPAVILLNRLINFVGVRRVNNGSIATLVKLKTEMVKEKIIEVDTTLSLKPIKNDFELIDTKITYSLKNNHTSKIVSFCFAL